MENLNGKENNGQSENCGFDVPLNEKSSFDGNKTDDTSNLQEVEKSENSSKAQEDKLEKSDVKFENDGKIDLCVTSENTNSGNGENGGQKEDKAVKESKKISFSAFIFSAICLVLAAVLTTFSVCNTLYKKKLADAKLENVVTGTDGTFSSLELLNKLFKNYSYYDLDEDEIVENVLKAYVKATGDVHARYFTNEEYAEYIKALNGSGVGIGINIVMTNADYEGRSVKVIQVVGISDGSPAIDAGIKIGDKIIYVGSGDNKKLIDEIGFEEASKTMKGEAGTFAEFTVLRNNTDGTKQILDFKVERKAVESISVYHAVSEADSSVGIVKITRFEKITPKQFEKAMDDLISKGCDKFVFDVRGNGGGDLLSITAVLSNFLNEGDVILSTVDNKQQKVITLASPVEHGDSYADCSIKKENIGRYKDYKMTVLCDGSTASAAELFVATLRDYNLADTVGTKTYGKGSMQSLFSLNPFGYSGALSLTTRMYFPPCGEGYDGIGISPDFNIELSEEAKSYHVLLRPQSKDNQLIEAINNLNK